MASTQSTVVGSGNPVLKWVLRVVVVGYLFFLVAWPSSLIVSRAFEGGIEGFKEALSDPDVIHALQLSLTVAVCAVATSRSRVKIAFAGCAGSGCWLRFRANPGARPGRTP